MIKCEVIKEFTLGKFDELKNIKRKRIDTKGKLYEGDTFECTEEMYKYLTGTNDKGIIVVKIIEVIPEKVTVEKVIESAKDDKEFVEPIKPKKKKHSKK